VQNTGFSTVISYWTTYPCSYRIFSLGAQVVGWFAASTSAHKDMRPCILRMLQFLEFSLLNFNMSYTSHGIRYIRSIYF